MLDRREALWALAVALGGPVALAQAKAAPPKVARAGGKPLFYAKDERLFVAAFADVLIPRTDTPGAIDADVPGLLDALMAAWASDATKESHRAAMANVRARLRELGGRDLERLPKAQRHAIVEMLDEEAYAAPPQPTAAQYMSLKRLVAQIYYATEIGATQELHYELIPGRVKADVSLADVGRTWAF